MRTIRIAAALGLWVLSGLVWQATVLGDAYDDAVEQAERLWADGKKTEAVTLYARVWGQRPDDVDRQILYGERSVDINNLKWAVNFFKTAELKVKDDPTRLYRVYMGYAKAYRANDKPNLAQPYEEKATALRESGKVKDLPPRRGTTEGSYTEGATTKSVTVSGKEGRYLKKRIAVSRITCAVGGTASFGDQIRSMLVTELGKTNRFIVVEREDLRGIMDEQDLAASGRVAKGSGPATGQIMGAQLMVKAAITDFEDQSRAGRRIGIGPVDVGRSQSSIRVEMDLRIYDTETGVILASENVSAQKVSSGREIGVAVPYFRWDDQKSQNSTLGYVTRELIQKALDRIIAGSAKVPWTARVMKVSGDELYFNGGAGMGVRVGDRFKVVSLGEALRDPDTGEVLTSEEKPVAEIEVTRAEEKFSVGRILSKKGDIKERDKVTER